MSTAPPPLEPPEAPRLRFEHALQVRRIWLDRMLIGALLVVTGLVANVVLEKYKADRGQSQFFLDKRLAAATDVRRALTNVTTSLFKVSEAPCTMTPPDPAELERLREAIANLTSALNSNSLLFDETYLAESNRAINIFVGVMSKPSALSCDARTFLADVARYITHQTKRQVAPDAHPEWDRFVPIALPAEEIDKIAADGYFVKNMQAWHTSRSASSAASATR